METSYIFSSDYANDLLLRSLIPLFVGIALAIGLSFLYCLKHVAKFDEEKIKRIGKKHYKIGLIVLVVYLIFTIIGTFAEADSFISKISFYPEITAVFFSFAFFFIGNAFIIRSIILKVDMFGNKKTTKIQD